MKKYFLFLVSTVFIFNNVNAQLPNSDVWLFSYSAKAGNYSFKDGKNISNHPGYDNQPFFSKDGMQMLYTSERDSGQTDIFEYWIKSEKNVRLTRTNVSEYSPEYSLGNVITAVVVEKDSTQRFWYYLFNEDSIYSAPLSETKNVAYSRILNDTTVFLCILPEPMSLFIQCGAKPIYKCAMNVNRSMCVYHQKNRDLFLYSQMKADSSYAIQALSNTGTHVSDFTPIPFVKGSQDFSVDRDGNIFMASGTKLFVWTIGKSKDWKEIADFSSQGLHKITRLAMSPDGKHIALVDNTN